MILQLLEHNLVLRGYDPAKIIPGKISTEKYECVIPLEENSAKFWRAAITKMYNDIVTESKGGDEKKEVTKILCEYVLSNILNKSWTLLNIIQSPVPLVWPHLHFCCSG